MESDAREYQRSVIGDYHDYCWLDVKEALRLIESVGCSLHNLPVATHQAISAMRRRHCFPDDGVRHDPAGRQLPDGQYHARA